MVQLAGDMASFNNASPEETLDALRSGLAGETEPLRKFGVFLSQSRIEAQALSSGLVKANVEMDEVHKRQANIAKSRLAVAEATKKYGKASIETQSATAKLEYEEKKLHAALAGKVPALTAAQKAQATYQLITKDTADAQGDFARTSDSAANASRVQAAEMENLTAELGQSLLPTYQALQQMLLKIIGFTAKHTTAVKILVGSVAALSAAILIANAAMKAWTAAQAIAKAATVAYTLAVRALNFALAANPIGLVVAALAALAAGLYLAYTRSETFRRIVNAAMGSVAGAVQAVGRAFNALREAAAWAFHWIIDHWKVALFAFGPIGAALYLIVTRFDQIRSAASSAFNAITAAIDRVIAAVRELIGWLGKIHVPKIKLPKIPGTHTVGYYAVPPAGRSAAGAYAAVGAGGLTVNVYGAVDPEGTARAIRRILERHDRRQGRIA
jgi:phage-related protein